MLWLKYTLVFIAALLAYIVGMQLLLDASWWLADHITSFRLPYNLGGLAWAVIILLVILVLALPIVGRIVKPKV